MEESKIIKKRGPKSSRRRRLTRRKNESRPKRETPQELILKENLATDGLLPGHSKDLNNCPSSLSPDYPDAPPVDNSAVADSQKEQISPKNFPKDELLPGFSRIPNNSPFAVSPDYPDASPVYDSAVTDSSILTTSSRVNVDVIASSVTELDIARSSKFFSTVIINKDREPSVVPPTKPTTSAEPQSVWKRARTRIALMLPLNWDLISKKDGFHIVSTSGGEGIVIQRSLFVAPDGHISAWVHGKRLPADHLFWMSVREVKLSAESTVEFSENVLQLVSTLRSYEICRGVTAFEDVWKYFPTAEVDQNRFQENLYKKTCRSAECLMLVNSVKVRRCVKCASLWRQLSSRHKSSLTESPTKTTTFQSMNTPQKKKAFQKIQKEKHALQMKNRRLQAKIAHMIRTEGVEVESDFSKRLIFLLETEEAKKK